MKKIKNLVILTTLSLSIFAFQANTSAAAMTYTVKSGETYWKIANKFGVSVTQLKSVNHKTSNLLYVGQKLTIPNSDISAADKELMARLVSAEAKGESYAGKTAVATVILNRIDNAKFPNTAKGVIYQKVDGYYAFTPVQNGEINKPADALSKKAVDEALAFRGQGKGSIYFYNPKTSSSKWILSREVTVTIGHHRFAK